MSNPNSFNRVKMRKYCAMDYVYLISVGERDNRKTVGEWTAFDITVNKRYRHNGGNSRYRKIILMTLKVKFTEG